MSDKPIWVTCTICLSLTKTESASLWLNTDSISHLWGKPFYNSALGMLHAWTCAECVEVFSAPDPFAGQVTCENCKETTEATSKMWFDEDHTIQWTCKECIYGSI